MRRALDRDLLSALVLFLIGGVALSAMGADMRNWIFPQVLTGLILLFGVLLLLRVALAAVAKRAPDLLRLPRENWSMVVDVVIFCAMTLVYILVVNGLGFWLASFLILTLASVYLTPQKTRRNLGIAVVVPLVACVLAYVVFLKLFYVPVPEATWWAGIG